MKKILMMLLGVAFATCAMADIQAASWITPYSADTAPQNGNASLYSCYFLDMDATKAATGGEVATLDKNAYATWLQTNFAANMAATIANAQASTASPQETSYNTSYKQYGFSYMSPVFVSDKEYYAVCFFDNGSKQAFKVGVGIKSKFYFDDSEDICTEWTAPAAPKPISVTHTSNGAPATYGSDYNFDNDCLYILNSGLTVSGTNTKGEGIYVMVSDVTLKDLTINLDSDMCGVYCEGDVEVKIEGKVKITATSDDYEPIRADGDVKLTGSGKLELRSDGNANCLMMPGKNLEFAVSGKSKLYAKYGDVIYCNDLKITDKVDLVIEGDSTVYVAVWCDGNVIIDCEGDILTKSNMPLLMGEGSLTISGSVNFTMGVSELSDGYAGIWSAGDVLIDCSGKIDFSNLGGAAILTDEGCTLKLTEKSKNVILRGYYPGEVGALELYEDDALILPDGWSIFGSTDIDAPLVSLRPDVEMEWNEDGEWEAKTSYIGNNFARTVSFGPGIKYMAWDEKEKKLVETDILESAVEVVTTETATFESNKWYVVTNTIERAGIKVNGEAHLILADGASLTVTGGDYEAGIEVPADKSLTIYGQSEGTGKLVANGLKGGAGIGGIRHGTCGTITINGGEINATGGDYGAGIGGSAGGSNGATITINGGTVKATGGLQGAGIGSGNYYDEHVGSRSDTDVIAINGGTITATGGQWGAGIGSGSDGFAATVTINGGTITASTVPDQGAEAIGSGDAAKAAATVTFGTGVASKYVWAGESATTGVTMTPTEFTADHSATYVELPIEIYTVVYDANGAAGVMSNSVFAVTKEVTLKKNAFKAVGYDFDGWTSGTNTTAFADEAKVKDLASADGTATLTAKWTLNTNGVHVVDFTSLTNTIATAGQQALTLPVTIGFNSGVKIPAGVSVSFPSVDTTGFKGIKYEDSTSLWATNGVLYCSSMGGEVTTDALELMTLANGEAFTSFIANKADKTEPEEFVDVVTLLGSNGKAYQTIADVLAADPRPETVKPLDIGCVNFTDFTDGKEGVYEVNEGETAKIFIAGGSKDSAVQAKLYCIGKSAGAIKTTSSKVTTTAVNSSVINLLARINPAAALMMLQSSSTATTVVPGKPQIYVDGKRVSFPITLNWEKGDTNPKVVEIVTAANKAVKPDRYVRLKIGSPVGCLIASGMDYAQVTIKDDGGADKRREVIADIYPAHAGKVSGAGFLKNEKSVITLTAKPASFAKTATFKGWFKAGEDGSIDVNNPVSTELKLKVGYEDFGRYIAYFEDVLALPHAVRTEVFKDGQIVEGVEGVVPADKDNSMLMLLVGAKVSLPISFSEETTGVTGVTAKGLPNGLKVAFDKKAGTCVITGKPTKVGTFFTTLTIKNAAGSSTLSLTFAVNSLAGRAVGLGRAVDGMPMPTGNIDMTIGSSGSVSAKINVAGVYNFSFSAKNLNYTCDNELNPIITIDLMNSKLEQELKLTWNSDEAAFEGEFMGSKFKAILLDSGSKTVATYTDKIFDSDKTQIGTIKVVVKESGLATITGKIDGNSFSTFGYAEEIDDEAYSYMTEFYAGSQKYYFFSEYVELYDEGECQILGRAAYQSDEVNDDDIRFGKPSSRPE